MKENHTKIFDISPTISPASPVFPGDVPFKQSVSMSTKDGDHISLSAINTTLHIGSHADAPLHYHKDGCDIEQRELDFYYGAAQVIDLSKSKPSIITVKDIAGEEIKAARVLFKTNSFDHQASWSNDFTAIDPDVVKSLKTKGVKTIGIDTPSVDPATSKTLPTHNAIFDNNIAILECLDLRKINSGLYTLSALPLKIKGGDASPVRAILIKN